MDVALFLFLFSWTTKRNILDHRNHYPTKTITFLNVKIAHTSFRLLCKYHFAIAFQFILSQCLSFSLSVVHDVCTQITTSTTMSKPIQIDQKHAFHRQCAASPTTIIQRSTGRPPDRSTEEHTRARKVKRRIKCRRKHFPIVTGKIHRGKM